MRVSGGDLCRRRKHRPSRQARPKALYVPEKNKPSVVNVMRMNGNLKSYLREVDEQAEETLFRLVRQRAKEEGVDEAMKCRDQLYWVGRMNSIRDRANKIVLNEVICV